MNKILITMSTGLRIKKARKGKGWSQLQLAKACGWKSKSRIANYEADEREPSTADLKKMADALGEKPEWLQFGVSPAATFIPQDAVKLTDLKNVPIIAWQDVKNVIKIDFRAVNTDVEVVPNFGDFSDKCYALRVENDSMVSSSPLYQSFTPGTIIIVDPDIKPQDGDFVVVYQEGAQKGIFRQYVIDGSSIVLKALNDKYPNPMIKLEESITICGVVVNAQLTLFNRKQFT